MTNNDEAWNKIFESLKIIESLQHNLFYPISAKEINTIGQREARLMAKFDTKEALPKIFKEAQLNINAISNGHYLIFKDPSHQSFITLPDYKEIILKKIYPVLPFELDTLVFSASMSESSAIDFAHHAHILSDYSGEKELKLTTRGRFFSDAFSYQLGQESAVNVNGVQIEVDAGYEGLEQFLIIEAKSSTRATFNIRQLYYPFRHFQNKTTKRIRNLLLSYSNGVYFFTEIEFSSNYYDYKIINNEAFEIVIEEARKEYSIESLLSQPTGKPAGIPIPQADDLNKVIDLLSFLADNPADKFAIANYFELDERQGDYYGNAGNYIGLTIREGALYKLSPLGQVILKIKNRDNRNREVTKTILQTQLFNDLVKLYVEQGQRIDDQQILDRISQEGLTGTTPARRKSTIKSWLRWIVNNIPSK